MALKAWFPHGTDLVTVSGLFQWDYGQILEIESDDIGSEIVEVHFACSNMTEAIVRSCSFSNSVGTVVIPDTCLEQSKTISAWVYQMSGTQGHTIKTIILPITARTRPSVAPDIPAEVSDRYTELITEINKAVEALEIGNITVEKAIDAENASHATSAGNAATSNFATTAQIAQYASSDTSKGTIEERLTALGFKEGAVTPLTIDSAYYTEDKNIIQRQGNYVIGHYRAQTLIPADFDSDKNALVFPIGTIPEEFRPVTAKIFRGYVEAISNSVPTLGEAEIEITPDGQIRVSNYNSLVENALMRLVSVSLGYNAAI